VVSEIPWTGQGVNLMARIQGPRRVQALVADGGDFLGRFRGGGESWTNGNIIDIICTEP